jgi:hypothetical protein
MNIPKIIFIVPYRDRVENKEQFEIAMEKNLADMESYKIFYSHQCDTRPFNRGAMKNIGFLAIKSLYPDNYKDIIFVFNDVDTWGKDKDTIKYETTKNIVKHFYGYTFALGGIFSILGEDFENIEGFPNFWGWGFEDNIIYDRCINHKLTVDRSNFYEIKNENIIQKFHGDIRYYNKRETAIYKYETPDTINNLHNINWDISNNMINVTSFDCSISPDDIDLNGHNINKSKIKIDRNSRRRNWKLNKLFTYIN